MSIDDNKLTQEQHESLFNILRKRFEENMHRHKELEWEEVEVKLSNNTKKLWSLNEMERTEGEPDVISFDEKTHEYLFFDCSKESPKGRRSVCYDRDALNARKKYKPKNSAMDMADEMGIEMLSEKEYRALQKLESVDSKTSTWVKTPEDIRKRGGAIFCDYRYDHVFVYHNGADSYYSSRGFRGSLRV